MTAFNQELLKYIFKCGDMNIELTNDYTYLGLIWNDFMKAEIAAKSANRP